MREKKFFIRGYRNKVDFATLYDPEPYSLKEAIDKADEYFKKIRRLGKIMLFELEEEDENKAVISMKKWRGFLELGIDGKIIITRNCAKYYFNRGKSRNG
ncbi:MAG: hypothetical protein GTO16_03940 [Candidatus Aminicenantes bacterium]|nr:hypothetical protein [Candidatus Aminicenantes bacterium]